MSDKVVTVTYKVKVPADVDVETYVRNIELVRYVADGEEIGLFEDLSIDAELHSWKEES